jgi:tetratricopeptide (TPR) repeat protein
MGIETRTCGGEIKTRLAKILVVSAVILVALTVVVCAVKIKSDQTNSRQKTIEDALAKLSQKNYQSAIDLLAKADSFPVEQRKLAYSYLGQSYFGEKDFVKAQSYYEKVLALETKDKDKAYYENLIANSLREQNKIDEAVSHYELSISSDSQSATVWVNLVNALRSSGQTQKADEAVARAKVANPTNNELTKMLAGKNG